MKRLIFNHQSLRKWPSGKNAPIYRIHVVDTCNLTRKHILVLLLARDGMHLRDHQKLCTKIYPISIRLNKILQYKNLKNSAFKLYIYYFTLKQEWAERKIQAQTFAKILIFDFKRKRTQLFFEYLLGYKISSNLPFSELYQNFNLFTIRCLIINELCILQN